MKIENLIHKYLNEELSSLTDFTDDIEILRSVILAESDAANFYSQLASKAKDKRVKNLLLDIMKEEDVHLYEATTMLEKLCPEIDKVKKQAEKEVNDMS